jgi:hypothetical protein
MRLSPWSLRVRSEETAIPGGFRREVQPSEAAVWSPAYLRRQLRVSKGVQRRVILGLLGAMERPIQTIESLGRATAGDLVRVSGRVRALGTTRAGAVWWIWGGRPEEDRHRLHERAYDFLLDDGTGEPAQVLVTGGYLLGTTHLRPGELVNVVGFCDAMVDPSVRIRPPRGLPMRAVLRSGGDLPLLIRIG